MRFKLTSDGRVFDSLVGKHFDPLQPKARKNATELARRGQPELYELIVRPTLNGGSIQFPKANGNSTPRMAGENVPAEVRAATNIPTLMKTDTLNIANPVFPVEKRLILPRRYSTNILAEDDIADLYGRSVAQATGSRVLHHPGEENLDANMLNRFFTSNLAAELVSRSLRTHFPDAKAEILARPLNALDRHTDGGSDIAGLPPTKSIDIKYVGSKLPSNVTSRVGNQLEIARQRSEPESILSFYQQAGGFIGNEDVVDTQRIINRLNDRPQEFTLRGHILSNDFLDNHLRSNLTRLREPQYHVPPGFKHGDNQVLVDYLMS